jgi:hypothetical protein
MSKFPKFSRISDNVCNSIVSGMSGKGYLFKNRNKTLSGKFPWIRIFSGAESGLILQSANLSDQLQIVDTSVIFGASSITIPGSYGNQRASGPIGKNFDNKFVYPSVAYQTGATTSNTNYFNTEPQDWVLRPSPVISSLEIKEGKDQISRVGTITIKCFSLNQLEEIQRYFMEPGFSILIEYGHNDVESLAQLIETKNTRTIVKQAADENLNYDILHAKRVASFGNYDSFFAFIVGGNVASEGDTFIVNISLRGMPGLPTFLQQQKNINQLKIITSGGKDKKEVSKVQSVRLYGVADLNQPGNSDAIASARRYKYMFNALPGERQTNEVAKYVDKAALGVNDGYGYKDLIGFDYPINEVVNSYKIISGTEIIGLKLGLTKEFKVGTWAVPREKLGSDYKYINFGLAIRILNANNGLTTYKIGDKEVKVKINPQATIGAFPKIFSTNPTKLVIPGIIPDFFAYYLNDNEVPIESIVNSQYDASIGNWSFVQKGNTPPPDSSGKTPSYKNFGGYFEKEGYYGDIEMLYVNFDVFCKAIKNSANKSIKDVLLDMLNEMSDAVNSFWNFQLVEQVNGDGNVEIGIIDENWSGYNPIPKSDIQLFRHSGELSTFLEANLQIDIPSEMTNQIILKRESYTSNPNSHGIDLGGIFTDKKDLFFTGVGYDDNSRLSTGTGAKPIADLKKDLQAAIQKKADWQKRLVKDKSFLGRLGTYLSGTGGATITEYFDPTTKELVYTEVITTSGFGTNSQKGSSTGQGVAWDKLLDEIKQLEDSVIETQTTTLSNNINKIDIIANPELTFMGSSVPKLSFEDGTFKKLRDNFRIYCCTDTQIFDILKNNAFEAYASTGATVGKTSILLPIKYTFKIIGKSGIRRGDIFNVIGIPDRYEKYGFFQVISIEQNIEGNLWTTTVIGQYRQHFEK